MHYNVYKCITQSYYFLVMISIHVASEAVAMPSSPLQVGSSGELHTSTHAMFVAEHRQRRAPLAQQDHDLEVGEQVRAAADFLPGQTLLGTSHAAAD